MFPLDTVGGGNTYAIEIVRNLAEQGIRVHMVVPKPLGKNPSFPEGVTLAEMGTLRFPFVNAPSYWIQSHIYMKRIPSRGCFDIIHCNDVSGVMVQGIQLPMVVTIHHSTRALQHYLPQETLLWAKEARGQSGIMPLMERRVSLNAQRIITVSELTKSTLVGYYGIDESIIDVVYNGVSMDFFGEYPSKGIHKQKDPSKDYFTLLYVGRPERRKGIEVLLRAFAEAIKERELMRLVIIGPGNWSKQRRFIRGHSLDTNIRIEGQVDYARLLRWYYECDAVVLPSYMEGFGLSIAEGMAAGKPVIAPRWSGVRELVLESRGGYIIDPLEPESLVRAILNLATLGEERRMMGKRNRRVAARFNWTRAAKETISVYEKCASTS